MHGGYYDHDEHAVTAWQQCAAGSTTNAATGATSCTPCAEGRFQSTATACAACDEGRWAAAGAGTSAVCLECPGAAAAVDGADGRLVILAGGDVAIACECAIGGAPVPRRLGALAFRDAEAACREYGARLCTHRRC